VARWFREAMRVAGPFGVPVPEYLPLPRLHLPLIEPDVQISRIRLSDKSSCVRPQQAAPLRTKLDKAQLAVQDFVGKMCIFPAPHLVLGTQPPA
jgi:hypothetical protein